MIDLPRFLADGLVTLRRNHAGVYVILIRVKRGVVLIDRGNLRPERFGILPTAIADVKRVAQKYLSRARVVLSVVPKGKKDQASKAAESETVSMVIGDGRGGRK